MNRLPMMLMLTLLAACSRDPTMAEKSAAAFRDAQTKGVAVSGGHEHGHGETTTAASTTSAPASHAAHATTSASHADHELSADSRHEAHRASGGAAHAEHAGMQHPPADAHAGHRAPSSGTAHAGHTATPRAPADVHAAHRAPSGGTTHAGHTATPRAPAPRAATGQPAATLQPDEFDAPAATSVAEAAKASGGAGAHDHHGTGEALYVCPMHPEVTSATPGSCPKCGMALVKNE
jgi:hypothetical protein